MKVNLLPSGTRFIVTLILMVFFSSSAGAVDPGRYNDPDAVNRKIDQIRSGSQGLVTVRKLAVSPGGTDILMLQVNAGNNVSRPAVLVAANLSGMTPLATEAALSLAERMSKNPSLCGGITWYIIPMGNPDAGRRFFARPLYYDPGNATPFNDDTDDATDEDGYNDLDGNGIITQMRVVSPDGQWIPLNSDTRLMRRADPVKGEKGIYRIYSEGIDDDGDGQYNEDTRGGTNVNINFPHLFKNFGRKSGLYPGAATEASSIMKFTFEHPEIAMVLSFGSSNFLLTPPQGGRKGTFDPERISVPDDIGKAMGLDTKRTYTMAEIMEAVQPMLPPGMQIDESMIASFLGLGAVVNPLPDDMTFYNRISEEYKEYLKNKGVKDERFDPVPPEDGSFELWAYYHLGVPVFSMDFWALPKVKEDKQQTTLTPEALEKMTADEFLALGPDKIEIFLKERGAPAQYNGARLMEMVKSGQLSLPMMAAMIKKMPAKSADDNKGDIKETAMLAFSDKWLEGKGFVEWKSFDHPALGKVEIGGFVPFTDNTPPPEMVDSLLDLNIPWIFELVKKLPRLSITETKVTSKGGGVYQVEAWVTNEGGLPFPTAMGKRNRTPYPAVLILEGKGTEILSGKKRTPVTDLGVLRSARYVWLIKASGKSNVTLSIESKQAGSGVKNLTIE